MESFVRFVRDRDRDHLAHQFIMTSAFQFVTTELLSKLLASESKSDVDVLTYKMFSFLKFSRNTARQISDSHEVQKTKRNRNDETNVRMWDSSPVDIELFSAHPPDFTPRVLREWKT